MKQVLVKKDEKLSEDSFTEFTLRLNTPEAIKPGANWLELEWPVQVMNSSDLRFFFTVDASLATAGITLSAHYLDKSKPKSIFLVLHNHNTHVSPLGANSPVASAHAYEPVQIRQVDQDFKEVIVMEPATTKPKRRGPKTPQDQKPSSES